MQDTISRQAAIDSLEGEIEVIGKANAEAVLKYTKMVCDKIKALPSAQPEQDSEVIFWEKRAKEYEDIILRFATEKAKGIKLDSIEITGERIIFKNSQPEQKSGEWIYDGVKRICPFCKDFIVTGRSIVKYCWNCGARLEERSKDAES